MISSFEMGNYPTKLRIYINYRIAYRLMQLQKLQRFIYKKEELAN